MTLTIELPAEAERRLREKAAQRGDAVEAVAAEIVIDALEREAQDTAEAIAGIRRGLGDFEEGRYRSFPEFAEEQRRKHQLASNG